MDCCIIIIGTVLVLYLNFYVGQKLLDHSNAIFEELRQVPFNNLTIKTQKMLLFMIMRSMKPCVLSIGGMYHVRQENCYTADYIIDRRHKSTQLRAKLHFVEKLA
ncbi:hypothetical protein HZH68_012597 [Vespula germanica]|uniref:Uncharacterized protein n=1 Tax=Vespula germanica TaxID=30212 RepID=A0A834MY02_VESGE|nr:hypothetical protein HZH68_012597 [Vespula germanica]